MEAECRGFPSQPVDGIDLAVVAEGRKHLGLFSRRVGVGRVTSVAKSDRRFKIGPGELREVTPQGFRVAANLIDCARLAKAGDMKRQLTLELRVNLKGVPVLDSPRRSGQCSHLPELRLAGASKWTKRFAASLRLLLENDLETAVLQNFQRFLLDFGMPRTLGGREHDVGDE